MRGQALEIKVGILVTVCLGLLIGFIVILGDFSLAEGKALYVDVPTSAGLKSGAPIKVAGVSAGKVESVAYLGGALDEATGRRVVVRVTLRIRPDMFPTLHEDAAVYITSQGLLGEKYVEIVPGTPTKPGLQEGAYITGRPPAQLELMASKVEALLGTMTTLLNDNRAHLTELIKNTNKTVKSFQGASAEVEGFIKRSTTKLDGVIDGITVMEKDGRKLLAGLNTAIGDGREIKGAISETRQVTRMVRTDAGPILKGVRSMVKGLKGTVAKFSALGDSAQKVATRIDANIDPLLKRAYGAIDGIDAILGDIKAMTKNLRLGKGTIGALISDKEMYEDVREMVKDLKRHPWKFLWKE